MKQILIIVGIILPLFLFGGCQTEQKTEAQNEFEHDLRGLYSDVQAITSQAQTRSLDGEWVPPTEAELELIFAEIARIAEENGIAEQVLASGYYQGEMPDLAKMDEYQTLQWIEANGTPEFYNLMLEVGEEVLDIEQIISNPNLLPNEKLGLITSTGVFTDDGRAGGGLGGITIGGDDDETQNVTAKQCSDARLIGLGACSANFTLQMAGAVVLAFVPGGQVAAGILATAAAGELAACIAITDALYDRCLQNVK